MLFPAKHIRLSESLLGLGAFILKFIGAPKNIDRLWSEVRQVNNSSYFPAHHSYNNFLLALDYLYSIGAIDLNDRGEIHLCG